MRPHKRCFFESNNIDAFFVIDKLYYPFTHIFAHTEKRGELTGGETASADFESCLGLYFFHLRVWI